MNEFKLVRASKLILTLVAAVVLQTQTASAQFTVPVYDWDFTTQSTTDTINGATASLANPGGLSAQGYTFADTGEGIVVQQPASVAVTGTYAIELVFSLDMDTGDYQRIIDFQNFTTDEGLYVYEDYFYFYEYAEETDIDLSNVPFMQDMTALITRDAATKVVTLRLDGQLVWSFVDTLNLAIFNQANNIMRFFEDDDADGGEHPAGTVKSIRVFTKPPSASGPAVAKARKSVKKAKAALKRAKKAGVKSRVARAKKKLKKAKKKLRLLLAS